MIYTKDCPYDYLPGHVFRWTVEGHNPAEGHPDDLVRCPECNGAGRVCP